MVLLKGRVDVLSAGALTVELKIYVNIECNFSAGGIEKLRVIYDQVKTKRTTGGLCRFLTRNSERYSCTRSIDDLNSNVNNRISSTIIIMSSIYYYKI